MFGKKMVVSVIALTAVCFGAFGAINRGGTLKSQPGSTGTKVSAQQNTSAATVTTGSRMATLPGLNNVSTKPKLPSSASAAQVGDLKDKLDQLAQDVADLANAGVDEGAVRDIINSELADKDYATHPELNAVDSAKYNKDVVDEKIGAIKPTAEIRYDSASGNLQYKDSDGSYKTFANRSDFAGADGADGKNIELQKTDDAIQWRVQGSSNVWTDLVALDDIKGADGSVDEQQLANAVSAAINDADLASKTDLSDYVDKTTYNQDKTAINTQLTTAQATAENALSVANNKLDKDTADTYYTEKGYSYSKAEVDSTISGKVDKSTLDSYWTSEQTQEQINAAKPNIEIDYDSDTHQLKYKDSNGEWQSLDIDGLTGADGKSAYQLWLDAGNTGTQEEFLASLKGADGAKGDKGDNGNDACVPKYSDTTDANGNTVVTITCEDDESKILGQYTVSKGAEGANPCPGGIRMEVGSTSDDGTTYNIICDDGNVN